MKDKDKATLHIDGDKFMSQLIWNSDTAPTIDEWMDESSDYWQQQNKTNKQTYDDTMCEVIDEWLDNDSDLLGSAIKVAKRKEHDD